MIRGRRLRHGGTPPRSDVTDGVALPTGRRPAQVREVSSRSFHELVHPVATVSRARDRESAPSPARAGNPRSAPSGAVREEAVLRARTVRGARPRLARASASRSRRRPAAMAPCVAGTARSRAPTRRRSRRWACRLQHGAPRTKSISASLQPDRDRLILDMLEHVEKLVRRLWPSKCVGSRPRWSEVVSWGSDPGSCASADGDRGRVEMESEWRTRPSAIGRSARSPAARSSSCGRREEKCGAIIRASANATARGCRACEQR